MSISQKTNMKLSEVKKNDQGFGWNKKEKI